MAASASLTFFGARSKELEVLSFGGVYRTELKILLVSFILSPLKFLKFHCASKNQGNLLPQRFDILNSSSLCTSKNKNSKSPSLNLLVSLINNEICNSNLCILALICMLMFPD